jgi:hypothetical protein
MAKSYNLASNFTKSLGVALVYVVYSGYHVVKLKRNMKIKFEKVFWSLKKIKILVYWHRYSGKKTSRNEVL